MPGAQTALVTGCFFGPGKKEQGAVQGAGPFLLAASPRHEAAVLA